MDIQESVRRQALSNKIGKLKEQIKSSKKTNASALIAQLNELEKECETLQSGIVMEISKTNPGKFRICRDYSIDCASNKKLKRLSR